MIWNTKNAPKDGTEIMAVGRITWSDEFSGGSSPFYSCIKWDGEQWLHVSDEDPCMSVARFYGEQVHVDYWLPMPGEGNL